MLLLIQDAGKHGYPPAFIANDMQKDHDKPDRIGNKDTSAAFAQLFP
ncbi:hypothetical protein [Sphingobium yanoikuyae]|nr:hypothetical protein [Sphingobium yanoikuyae]